MGETFIDTQGSHISYVIGHSYVFLMRHKWVCTQYEETGEPIGFEGKACSVILKEVLSKGWVGIRETLGKDARWTFQFSEFAKSKETLRIFIASAIEDGDIKSCDRIVLNGIDDGFYKETNAGEIYEILKELI